MPTFSNGYNYRRKITIDYTKVNGGADLTDFATYFKTTNADLKSVANGGKVQLPTVGGFPLLDIRFELLNGTKLDHEIVEYSPATGLLTVFFRIPTLSYTANTQVYMFYGKAITTAEDNQYGVWHSSYRGVWHGSHENPYIYNGNTAERGITKLGDYSNPAQLITYGYRSGDLTWILNWFEGASNPGEIQIQGTTFTDHLGNVRTFSSTLPNKSVAFYDGAALDDYLVYTVTSAHTRFGTNDSDGMHPNSHPNFFVARYSSGQWYQVSNGTGALKAFTPEATDVIVGRLGITTPPNLDAAKEKRFETGYMPDSTQYTEHMTADETRWLNGENAGKIFEYGRTYAGADYSRAGNPNFNIGGGSEAGVSFWFKTSDTDAAIFSYEHSTQGNALLVYLTGGTVGFYRGPAVVNVTNASLTNNTWHYMTLRWRQSSGGWDIHLDGVLIGSTGTLSTSALPNNGYLMLGQEQDSPGGGLSSAQALSGQIEEVRFSDDIDFMTGARHITEYNNMSSPSTFYSIASEETPLTVADSTHAHAVDGGLSLVQHIDLTMADALHAHTVDNIALTQKHSLLVADALHGQTVDGVVLTQNTLLVVADALHGHEVEEITLVDGQLPVPEDALHGHAVDNITLTQRHFLSVASASHNHLVDNILVGQAHTLADVADALHAHDVEPVTLTQAHFLAVSDALHAQTTESVALFQRHVLAVQDALQAHVADTPFVYTLIPLIVEDTVHGHFVDATLVQIWKKRKPNSVLPTRDLPRIMIIDNTERTKINPQSKTKPRGAAVQGMRPVLLKETGQPRVRDFPK